MYNYIVINERSQAPPITPEEIAGPDSAERETGMKKVPVFPGPYLVTSSTLGSHPRPTPTTTW